MIGIYKITNQINDKCYIGQSLDIESRWKSHKKYSTSKHLNNAIKKYGIDRFSFEVLYETTYKENLDDEMVWIKLNIMEMAYIDYYKANKLRYPKENNYNLMDGGEGVRGYKMSPEQILKNSQRQKGIKRGPQTEEHKKKQCESRRGQKRTVESIDKMRLAKSNVSDETKHKISEASKKLWQNMEYRKKIQESKNKKIKNRLKELME